MNNQRGIILIAAYLVVVILLILGSAFITGSISENRIADREKDSILAFYMAEAGIESALYDLKQDFGNGDADPWRDGDINGNTVGPSDVNFYSLYGGEISLGDGSYDVELKNVAGKDNEIWLRSTGNYGSITNKTIQVYMKMVNYSPWNTAIFAGTGSSGTTINGNVDIRGSVHILGTGLTSADSAINMSGNANVGNNYQGIPTALDDRVPDIPTVIFNGETVQSLDAEVHIKNGLAGLNGDAKIGDTDNSDNPYKETVDGVYITDGYTGNKGAANVYSDNGTANTYDLGDAVSFPSLSDPYQSYATYQEYLRDNALVISDPAQLDELDDLTPSSSFSYSDGTGNTISMDGEGNLVIAGIVYIEGGDLEMEADGSQKTITYTGTGVIVVAGDGDSSDGEAEIDINLLTSGVDSFPNNVLGIMTPGDIEFDGANIDVMGVFYAEGEIEVKKQTNIAGTMVSNYFDIGSQVPSIYQVPSLFDNLPSGMIASDPVWIMRVVSWQEI